MSRVAGCGDRRVALSNSTWSTPSSSPSLKDEAREVQHACGVHGTGVLYVLKKHVPACARAHAPPASMRIARVTCRVPAWQAASSPSRLPHARYTWSTTAVLDTMIAFSSSCATCCAQVFCALCRAEAVDDRARAWVAWTGAAWVLPGHLYASVCLVWSP